MSSFGEGKEAGPYDNDELYDDSQPVYRSLPASSIHQVASHNSSFDLEEEPVYRDMPLGDFSRGMGIECVAPAPGFMSASFDCMDAPTYRSIPGFPEMVPGISDGDGPSYRSMSMYAAGEEFAAHDGLARVARQGEQIGRWPRIVVCAVA